MLVLYTLFVLLVCTLLVVRAERAASRAERAAERARVGSDKGEDDEGGGDDHTLVRAVAGWAASVLAGIANGNDATSAIKSATFRGRPLTAPDVKMILDHQN